MVSRELCTLSRLLRRLQDQDFKWLVCSQHTLCECRARGHTAPQVAFILDLLLQTLSRKLELNLLSERLGWRLRRTV